MAYTKIIVIHSRLDRCLGYTQDEEKTSLETVLDYAMNRDIASITANTATTPERAA